MDPSTDHTDPQPTSAGPPPVICTLDDGDGFERTLEWTDLGRLSLRTERLVDGVASTFPLEHAGAVEDLVARENACCGSWLRASVTRSAETVRLEMTTSSPEGLAMITAMAALPTDDGSVVGDPTRG